jgi:hypothetical protein
MLANRVVAPLPSQRFVGGRGQLAASRAAKGLAQEFFRAIATCTGARLRGQRSQARSPLAWPAGHVWARRRALWHRRATARRPARPLPSVPGARRRARGASAYWPPLSRRLALRWRARGAPPARRLPASAWRLGSRPAAPVAPAGRLHPCSCIARHRAALCS